MRSSWVRLGKISLSLLPFVFCLASAVLAAPGKNKMERGTRQGHHARRLHGISQDEGKERIEAFRKQRLGGDYSFLFELEQMPRRGKSKVFHGMVLGSWNEKGPVSLVTLNLDPKREDEGIVRFLVQNGYEPVAWKYDSGRGVRQLSIDEFFEPLVPEGQYTVFDLLMPFIYWDDFVYEGPQRVKGRTAHVFQMNFPDSYKVSSTEEIKGVNIALDSEFNALLQIEHTMDDGDISKSWRILDFKKVKDQWIPSKIDILDLQSHNKTRFKVTSAALNLDLPKALFEEEGLKKSVKLDAGIYTRF